MIQSEITADYEKRCYNSPPSIGAYEPNPLPSVTSGQSQGSGQITTGSAQGSATSGCNCPQNAECVSGQCVCLSGFSLQNGECVDEEDGSLSALGNFMEVSIVFIVLFCML